MVILRENSKCLVVCRSMAGSRCSLSSDSFIREISIWRLDRVPKRMTGHSRAEVCTEMHRYTIERTKKRPSNKGRTKMTMMDKREEEGNEGTRDWRSWQLIMISPESERVRDQTAQEDRTREETLLCSTDEKSEEAHAHTHARANLQSLSAAVHHPLSPPPPPPPHLKQTDTHTPPAAGRSQISGGDAACESSTESISQGRELVSGLVDCAIWLGSWGRRDGSWTHMAAKKTRSLHFRLSTAKGVPQIQCGRAIALV
jgi:hypothetical protein